MTIALAPKRRIRVRGETSWKIRSTQIHSRMYTGKLRLSRIALAIRTRMRMSFAQADWSRKPRKCSLRESRSLQEPKKFPRKRLTSPLQLHCWTSLVWQSKPRAPYRAYFPACAGIQTQRLRRELHQRGRLAACSSEVVLLRSVSSHEHDVVYVRSLADFDHLRVAVRFLEVHLLSDLRCKSHSVLPRPEQCQCTMTIQPCFKTGQPVLGQGAGRRKTMCRASLYARVSTHDQQIKLARHHGEQVM